MKYHFIRDMVEKKIVELRHISTLDYVVDIFTKAIVKAQFLKLRNILVSPLNIKGENVGVSELEGEKFKVLQFFGQLLASPLTSTNQPIG